MTENLSSDVASAIHPDGFIDFYELLGVPGDAELEIISARINGLYDRAQGNREHRHIAKRREAEMLLELIPHCMDVLLDANNRIAYDAYAVAARAGAAPTDFETFMNDVIKESPGARSGILAMREESNTSAPAGASVVSTRSGEQSVVTTEPKVAMSTGNVVRTPVVTHLRKPSGWMLAGVFAAVFVLCDLGLALPPAVTLSLSPLATLLTAVLGRRPVARVEVPQSPQRISA